MTVTIERVGTSDLPNLVAEARAPWNMAGVLLLRGPTIDLDVARRALDARAAGVPRLRQRLQRVPLGYGRPIWADDPAFDIRRHVDHVTCPPPGDQQALLDLAAVLVARPPPEDRPLWSMTFVSGLADGRQAVIVTVHHVLADGIGGLAVLGALTDGIPPPADPSFPRPTPARSALLLDTVRSRVRALGRLRQVPPALASARHELRISRLAPRSSLNGATGARRRYAVARAPLAAVKAAAHARGGTVNDLVLAAIAGALATILAERGEPHERLVASVPVSQRTGTTVTQLGNQVGTMPIELPMTIRDPDQRLRRIATTTRAHKHQQRGGSAFLLQPLFRLLAALGIWRWLVERQRASSTSS